MSTEHTITVGNRDILVCTEYTFVGDMDSRGPNIWKAWVKYAPGLHEASTSEDGAVEALKVNIASNSEFLPDYER